MKPQKSLLLSVLGTEEDLITINVAGSCTPNNNAGFMTYGVVISQYGQEMESIAGERQLKSGNASNICAEHIAIVYGLKYLIKYELLTHPILVISSIRMCPRLSDINEDTAYAPVAHYINDLIYENNINLIDFAWKPRIENQKAAVLANNYYQSIIRG